MRARSAGVMRWTERMLTVRMGAPLLVPNYDSEVSALGRATSQQPARRLIAASRPRLQQCATSMHPRMNPIRSMEYPIVEHGVCYASAPLGRTKDLDVSPARILARFAASILGVPRQGYPYHAPGACSERVRERLRGERH